MILPDVNILIYAFRNDSANHQAYHAWLSETVNSMSPYGMSPQVLSAVVRVCTHPRIFARPSRLGDVLAFCRVLLEQPNCTTIAPSDRHWTIFTELCRSCACRGNLVQNAWYAALAMDSGCEWITNDRDYSRFEGLQWRPPF